MSGVILKKSLRGYHPPPPPHHQTMRGQSHRPSALTCLEPLPVLSFFSHITDNGTSAKTIRLGKELQMQCKTKEAVERRHVHEG